MASAHPMHARFNTGPRWRSVAQPCPILTAPQTAARPPSPSATSRVQSNVHGVSAAIQPSHPVSPLLPPSIFPSIRVFSSESALHIRRPKHWRFSSSLSPPSERSGLISFRTDWLGLLLTLFPKNLSLESGYDFLPILQQTHSKDKTLPFFRR